MLEVINLIGTISDDEPTLVLIPGGMTTPRVFNDLIQTQRVNSCVVDFSTSEGPWDVTSIAQRLANMIKARPNAKVILLGYSLGGVIAMLTYPLCKDQIKALVLSNTGLNTKGHGDPKVPQKILDNWGDDEYHQAFIDRCFSQPLSEEMNNELLDYIHSIDIQAAYQPSYSIRQIDVTEVAQGISCPTLIVHGLRDKARTIEHARELKETIRDSLLFFVDGGHTVFYETINEYSYLLKKFIEDKTS